jgi:membrane-bound lytic murein transglycosylase F
VDSSAFRVSRYFYPEARAAFDLSEPQPLGWALKFDELDDSLVEAVDEFFHLAETRQLIARIDKRYFRPRKEFDYVGVRTFLEHVDIRLPKYKDIFREAAANIGMDWRLLAAIGYQESHWNPVAVSPTGVKGIMMLTQDTARMMGVADREDPRDSILGGARYLNRVKNKIPTRIPEPDRTWFALAAYNIGFGHLEDARIITEMQDGDPDVWADVRTSLPLLTQKKWYSRVKRGYARGYAPVHYVDNVRSYYEALMWLTSGDFSDPVTTRAEPAEGDENNPT